MCFSSWLQQTQGKSQSLLCYHTVIVLDLPLVDQSFSTLTGGSSGYGDESVSPYKHRPMVEGCSDYDPFTVDSGFDLAPLFREDVPFGLFYCKFLSVKFILRACSLLFVRITC
ncbi:hypothetical protein Peur_039641 [Populus x canadensis]